MKIFLFLFTAISLLSFNSISQENKSENSEQTEFYQLRKGRLFISWGYNRSVYTTSNIRFWGDGYDFTIKKAIANDRQTKFDPNVYFNPSLLTIPQYNFRIGYFFRNNWSLTFNVDHMKYVLDNSQTAVVNGTIEPSASPKWAKDYDNEEVLISDNFVKYEHTDGLNIASIELDYSKLLVETKNKKFAIDFVGGAGIGGTIPKTNARLFNIKGNDAFHWSGGVIALNAGVKFYFFKKFFLHTAGKAGFVWMPNVATNGLEKDKASQSFSFLQANFTVGYQFLLRRKKTNN